MALFSFRHSVKSFSPKVQDAERAARKGQTLAHLRYISRATAARHVARARVHGSDPETAVAAEAEAIRKKGRVAERFIIALPVEATEAQRVHLAEAFAERLTGGKAGYVLAVHDRKGNDRSNPHLHLVAFDGYERSGSRGRPRSILGMARKGAVERAAELWADTHNEMMRGWGYGDESCISHLSHAARGIDAIPTIHEGSAARSCAAKGLAPEIKPKWRTVDGGHTRIEANILIKEINALKEMSDVQWPERTGLGERHGANSSERGEGCRAIRPHPEGRRRSIGEASHRGSGGERGGEPDQAPATVDRGAGSPREQSSARVLSRGAGAGLPPILAHLRRAVRRRSVRRTFRALVMIRDTLRARLHLHQQKTHREPDTAKIAPSLDDEPMHYRQPRDEITLG